MTVNAVQEAAVMSNTSTTYKNEQDQRQILVKRQTTLTLSRRQS